MLIFVGTAAGSFTVVMSLTASLFPSLAVGVLAATAPAVIRRQSAERRHQAIADAWPDALSVVRARLGSGTSIRDAFTEAVAQNPVLEPWRGELVGPDFVAALESFGTAVDEPLTDRVVATMAVAHRVGGGRTGAIISSLAESVADEVRVRKAHEAAVTEQRLTAIVALIAPWALLVLSAATNPESAATYRTASGGLVVSIGVGATMLGYGMTHRALRLTRMPRTFQ